PFPYTTLFRSKDQSGLSYAFGGEPLPQGPIMGNLAKSVFSSALIFLTLAACASAEERIKVAVSNFSPSYMPMFMAIKRGYYAEEGLAGDMILIAGLKSYSPSLASNSNET